MRAYINTDFIISLYNASDMNHERAVKILEKYENQTIVLCTGMNVLLESLTIIAQRISKKISNDLLKEFRSGKLDIINPSEEIVGQAEEIFLSIRSKNVSYSDCLSFAIMKAQFVSVVFSFDMHFKKQGFQRLGVD